MINNKYLQRVAIFLQPLLLGYASSHLAFFISNKRPDEFRFVRDLSRRTSLAPPSYVYSIVWPILYILIGFAALRILSSKNNSKNKSNALYMNQFQLFISFTWMIIYFGISGMREFGFILGIIFWLSILLTIRAYAKVDRVASYLLLPYIGWVTFALYLMFMSI